MAERRPSPLTEPAYATLLEASRVHAIHGLRYWGGGALGTVFIFQAVAALSWSA